MEKGKMQNIIFLMVFLTGYAYGQTTLSYTCIASSAEVTLVLSAPNPNYYAVYEISNYDNCSLDLNTGSTEWTATLDYTTCGSQDVNTPTQYNLNIKAVFQGNQVETQNDYEYTFFCDTTSEATVTATADATPINVNFQAGTANAALPGITMSMSGQEYGTSVTLTATMDNTAVPGLVSLRAAECTAINPDNTAITQPLSADYCWTFGFTNPSGWTVAAGNNLQIVSPSFELFKFAASNNIRFECTFTFCTSTTVALCDHSLGVDNNQCDAKDAARRKRSIKTTNETSHESVTASVIVEFGKTPNAPLAKSEEPQVGNCSNQEVFIAITSVVAVVLFLAVLVIVFMFKKLTSLRRQDDKLGATNPAF